MSEGQASFRDELQVVILCVSSKWFDGRINLSSHWSHSTSGLHQSHIRFDNFLFELAAVSPVLLEPWNTCESLPLRAFLRPRVLLEKFMEGRRIRQRVCQLTHSDLVVSHGAGKKARPEGTSRGRGESLLPT